MLSILIGIIGILFTILFVVGTHESAHFLTARLLGVKVLRFSIGFGKTLLRWRDKRGTEYVFALIPLGGYVKMLDETEGDVPAHEQQFAYNRQPFYKKFLIVLAGPLCNLLCALALYWLLFMIGIVTMIPIVGNVTPNSIAANAGLKANEVITAVDGEPTKAWTGILLRLLAHYGNEDHASISVKNTQTNTINTYSLDLTNWRMDKLTPDPLTSLGITPYEPPIPLIISVISPDSPAAASPLKIGDKILAINNKPVKNWRDITSIINELPEHTVIFTVERELKSLHFPVKLGYKRYGLTKKAGYLGIAPAVKIPDELLRKIQYGPITAVVQAWRELSSFTYFNLLLFGKLLSGKLPIQSLGGPITIFESAGTALNYGFISFLHFLAFMSISIGIINLFPIPGLDGGHLFIQSIEAIIRRPLPDRILETLYRIGIFIILFVLIQSLANDILRLY